MTLHSLVGFVAGFPMRNDGVEPAGKELAEFVHAHLAKAGFATSAPANREDWAWEMYTRDGKLTNETIVGRVDDMTSTPPRQWLITNDCPRNVSRWLFRKAEFLVEREKFLRRFCEAIDQAMKADSRFSHISWYDPETFDKPGDVASDRP